MINIIGENINFLRVDKLFNTNTPHYLNKNNSVIYMN